MNKLIRKIYKFVKSKYFVWVCLSVILLGGFGVRLYKINNPVADWHSWRQADTASVSKVYVQDGIDLLHPKYHDVSKIQTGYFNPNGYRYVEFPIYNALNAMLYQSFPVLSLEVWGRLLSIFSALLTVYFLFEIGKRIGGSAVGLMAAFFYAFIPYNIYFTRVILPDPMSVMLGVGSVYLFMRYLEKESKAWLISSSSMFGLAMLVKPHAIFFAVPIAYLTLDKWGIRKTMSKKWLFISLNIIFLPFFLWRIWMYQAELLRGIAHWAWSFNGNHIRFRPAFWRWLFGERVGKIILGTWGLSLLAVGLAAVKSKKYLIYMFLLGSFLYMSVFASANVMHDYYQLFIVPSICLVAANGAVELWNNKSFNFIFTKLFLGFVIVMMLAMGFYEIKDNYRINDTGMIGAGQEADKILPKDALVIAPYNGDTTFLYQTNRWGWPQVTTSIDEMIADGADYYISVNQSDPDTINFRKKFATVEANDHFVILDLHKEISE